MLLALKMYAVSKKVLFFLSSLFIRVCECYLPQGLKLAVTISSEDGVMICVAVESLRVEEGLEPRHSRSTLSQHCRTPINKSIITITDDDESLERERVDVVLYSIIKFQNNQRWVNGL